ncbi:uncharacterized protein LOC135817197 [Sycon ciliatum]|uniref:uncharacterized protein LOC135817197 n=1 Tax=Sycon ciliatum TaxID=27933 RepID=UPI0031F6E820
MSFGCLSAFSKRRIDVIDPPMTPSIHSHAPCENVGMQGQQSQQQRVAAAAATAQHHRRHGALPTCPRPSQSSSLQRKGTTVSMSSMPAAVPTTMSSSVTGNGSVSSLSSLTEIVQVVQAFCGEAGDELTVRAGQRLRVLYVEGSWTYASTLYNIPGIVESCGFVPTEYCQRIDQCAVSLPDGRRASGTSAKLSTAGWQAYNADRSEAAATEASLSRHDSEEFADYVVLRSPTTTELSSVTGGFPYAATLLYNFSDDAVDHASVRRGETVAVLGTDPKSPDWSRVQRRNGQQGFVPTCFLQQCKSGALLSNQSEGSGGGCNVSRSDDTSSCSTVTSHRCAAQGSGQCSDGIIRYQTAVPRQQQQQHSVEHWVESTAKYTSQDLSPGHSTASSDSGYAAIGRGAVQQRIATPQSATPTSMHGRSPCPSAAASRASPPTPAAAAQQSGGDGPGVHDSGTSMSSGHRTAVLRSSQASPPGKQRNSSPQEAMHCLPTSSNDSGSYVDEPSDLPPPPDAILHDRRGYSSDRRPPSQRKLAQRRPLGPQEAKQEALVSKLADQLVQLAARGSQSPDVPPPLAVQKRRQPPPIAPKPSTKGRKSPASDNASPQPVQSDGKTDDGDCKDSCLLVVSRFMADSPNKLSVEKGDVVYGNVELAHESRGWVWVYSPRHDQHGFIPVVYTQPCNADGVGGVVTEI